MILLLKFDDRRARHLVGLAVFAVYAREYVQYCHIIRLLPGQVVELLELVALEELRPRLRVIEMERVHPTFLFPIIVREEPTAGPQRPSQAVTDALEFFGM